MKAKRSPRPADAIVLEVSARYERAKRVDGWPVEWRVVVEREGLEESTRQALDDVRVLSLAVSPTETAAYPAKTGTRH